MNKRKNVGSVDTWTIKEILITIIVCTIIFGGGIISCFSGGSSSGNCDSEYEQQTDDRCKTPIEYNRP